VQPVRGRTAGGGRPALVSGVLLLVASLVLLVPPLPGPLDVRSISSSSFRPPVEVLVQGPGAAAAVAAVGGRPLAALPIVDGLLARVPGAEAAALSRRPGVRAVTDADRPLNVRAAVPAPTTGGVDNPEHHDAGSATLSLRGASHREAGLARADPPELGVAVGVLDTGIADSGDLAGRVVASADLSGEWSFSDSYGHGTFMAGLIAGSGQGGGPAGVAPGADLVDLKVAGADGSTTLGQVLAAMQLADAARERWNLRILNVSLGAPADDPATAPLTEAVERLWADGVTVVAAAGNEGGGVDAPGLDPYVVTVGALDRGQGGPAVPAWSSRGPDFAGRTKPDLVAPGVGLVGLRAPGSTIDLANPAARVGDRYLRGSGTSMATAVVAGAAAVVAAAHPDWGPDRVKAALTGAAGPLERPAPAGGAARSDGSGAGTLDLEAALAAATVQPANADLFPLRPVGGTGAPASPPGPLEGLGWRPGGSDGLRWAPAAGLPGPTAGAADAHAWTAHPWLSGRWTADPASARSWAAQQWLARVWAARRWAAAGLAPAGWAALQWSWGGRLAATLDGPGAGLAGAVDRVARSWAARSWAERAWGPDDLAARSWAARSWAELAWAARSWAAVDWTARSWASRRWAAGAWAARSWARRH
jgi:serine protease AprX